MSEASRAQALLKVEKLSKRFDLDNSFFAWFKSSDSQKVQALQDLSFHVAAGETLGILGESGSGKSTLARVLMGVYQPDSGKAWLGETSIFSAFSEGQAQRLKMLKKLQMVFQDPYGSLDPRMTVRQIISEPLKIHGIDADESLLIKTLEEVGLTADCLDRYPAEFSGGQRQRIGICRAVILDPDLIIADEAVSALDVSVQAQILELLSRLRVERKLSMIFISHDVAVVRQISDRIILLYRGHLVEELPADCLLEDAAHPYTLDLLSSAQYLREAVPLNNSAGRRSSLQVVDEGCCYRETCKKIGDRCKEKPPAVEVHPGHIVYCWNCQSKNQGT